MKQYLFLFLLVLRAASLQAQTAKTITATAVSLRGEPAYQDGFKHFDYVYPDAPRGGSLVCAATGTYDNFHRYALRGNCAEGYGYFYDTLLKSSSDELSSYYPLIAEKIEYAEDYSFIIFYIDSRAKDQEGFPITAEDAAFSFNLLYTKGVPQFRSYYAGVTATVLDKARVRFDIPLPEGGGKGDKEKMLGLCESPVFPKRFWDEAAGHDFAEPLTVPPLGTGPYRVKEYKMGQYITLERVKNYWAADLPVNKGQFNFDIIRYDYYRDETVSLEAFKAGEYDFRTENSALNWATQYTGKNFESGKIKKEEVSHDIPQAMQAFTFNIQRPVFQDRRVRKALNYFLDFEWMNKNLFYNQYTRTRSYFQNTEYAARGLPSDDERAILEPIRDKIPAEVFTEEYIPPVTDGTGLIRAQAREAMKLFNDAGWELSAGKLTNKTTGEQMTFELLIYTTSSERVAIPLQRNLERYGIDMRIRLVDTSQYINRLRSRDFDIIARGSPANPYPSAGMAIIWHSRYIDSTWNTPGVSDPAVDYLIDRIMANQEDDRQLLYLGHALDRVLTWNFYVIPEWHLSKFWLAYIDKFEKPAIRPRYDTGLDTWWVKPGY
jgi:microcin C transport system substrate-binding protein